jgi:penicillin amidase
MNDALAQRLRLLASAISLLLLAAVLAGGWFYFQVRASLPQLDGTHAVADLGHPVTVARDALGVPTIHGETRADVARALGFLHAQDRLFQMDLLRRRAAGELAELFGKAALPLDRANKPHHFRALSREVLASLPVNDRALLDAYAAGVNAGRAALRQKPFEYLLLRTEPRPWLAEDSLLVFYAMVLDLQDPDANYERSLTTLRDRYGSAAVAFFAPLLTPDDAALDHSTAPLAPIPGERQIDLRESTPSVAGRHIIPAFPSMAEATGTRGEFFPGSNNFALSGANTSHGAALLANDPHLTLAMPNIWYRAVLEWPDTGTREPRRLVGVSLPGLPVIVLGSNGHIAWGLTVAFADTSDLISVPVDTLSHRFYRVPGDDSLHQIETRRDTIAVKGGPSEIVETDWTVWGPIIGSDAAGRFLVHHWTAYDPAATNLDYLRLETATTVAEAVAIAHASGIPAHNFLVADSAGAIGWTVAGKIPRRVGYDGRFPVPWAFGDRRWDGFLRGDEIPTVITPPDGRLWTANNRTVGGEALQRLGDGGYASPPRATQIRDGLAAVEHATPRDLLAIQLDDRALFLARWQKLLLAVLTPEATAGNKSRTEFRQLVETWNARASTDSVGYRLVRAFRDRAADLVLSPIFAPCVELQPTFDWHHFNYEPALWTLVNDKPAHLLAPEFATWDALLLGAVDRAIDDIRDRTPLARAAWGERNRAHLQHPFSHILPAFLARYLNAPADPLPGDSNMPRFQTPNYGASMRLVVSPGHEDEGVFEMPGGQSGHPLSPFYLAGHEAWVRGEPTPLLPGQTVHTLTLLP